MHFDFPAFHLPRAKHARRIEAPGNLPVGCDGNHAAIAVYGRKLLMDDFIGSLLQREALVLNQSADLARHGVADKKLSHAGP